jgi:hypothetical protein
MSFEQIVVIVSLFIKTGRIISQNIHDKLLQMLEYYVQLFAIQFTL